MYEIISGVFECPNGDQIARSECPNAPTGDRIAFPECPNASNGDQIARSESPNASTGDQIAGSESPNASTGDRIAFPECPNAPTGDQIAFSKSPRPKMVTRLQFLSLRKPQQVTRLHFQSLRGPKWWPDCIFRASEDANQKGKASERRQTIGRGASPCTVGRPIKPKPRGGDRTAAYPSPFRHSFGVLIGGGAFIQGFCLRFTACLYSIAPPELRSLALR